MKRIPRKPSPAMVVAFFALCVALAGTAQALPGHNRVKRDDIARNAVRTSDIATNAIRTRHIKSAQVTRSKIAKRSIDSALVATDALTGDDILESSLSKVPDADKIDGKDLSELATGTKVARFTLASGQTREVFKTGPLTLSAQCTISGGGDTAEILISTSQDNAAFEGTDSDADLDTGDPASGRQFVVANGATGTPQFDSVTGSAVAADGSVINGASLFAGVNVLGSPGQCVFGGNVTS
jgi:hypothetical protein